MYGYRAFRAWLSKTNLEKLQVDQNNAAGAIICHLLSTPAEFAHTLTVKIDEATGRKPM